MTDLDPFVQYAIIGAVGIAAGFINTLAGGGSLLSLPALMLLGASASVANATNRVSILLQSIVGGASFDRAGKLPRQASAVLSIPAVVGAVVGAFGASRIPEPALRWLLLTTMVVMALVAWRKPKLAFAEEGEIAWNLRERPLGFVLLFGAGLYGGLLQAGNGFVLLFILGGVLRYDLVRANALKVVIAGAYTVLALVVFSAADQVDWAMGLALAAGTMIGALIAARLALRSGQAVLRHIVLGAVLLGVALVVIKPWL